MSGEDTRGDEGDRRPRALDRREYVGSLGAAGIAGISGVGGLPGVDAVGTATGQGADSPPAPHGLRVVDLSGEAITVAWYHRSDPSGETPATAYEVLVDGSVRRTVDAPDGDGSDGYPERRATVTDLDPATSYAVGVRATGDGDGRSATATLSTSTLDPSLVGRYDVETMGTGTSSPTNWATIAADGTSRAVRIRGGVAPGGTCGLASVRELRYDEDADELRVLVDVAADGSPICPDVEGELQYEVTAVLARAPQTVVVEHADVGWRRSAPLLGPDPAPLAVAFDVAYVDDAVAVGDSRRADLSLTVPPDGGPVDYDVTVAVEDPSVASIDEARSDVLSGSPEVADDGASLRWTASGVTHDVDGETDVELATLEVDGDATGSTGLTATVRRSYGETETTVHKAATESPLPVVEEDPEDASVSQGDGEVPAAVADYEFTIPETGSAVLSEWGDVAVSEDRRRVAFYGQMGFAQNPPPPFLQDLRFEDGELLIAVGTHPHGLIGSASVGYAFDGVVDLDRPVDRVVLEYPTRTYRRLWEPDLGGDYERFSTELATASIEAGERTELSMTLDGIRAAETPYYLTVSVDRPSVAGFVDASLPDWTDADPSVSDDDVEAEITIDPDDHDVTEPIDLGTAVLEGTNDGAATVRYVLESYRDGDAVALGSKSGTYLTVGDASRPTPGPPAPPSVGDAAAVPTDPDDDGLYEDVNGNDRQDVADAVDLFQHREDVARRYFDFTDSDDVDIGDAVALFRENAD